MPEAISLSHDRATDIAALLCRRRDRFPGLCEARALADVSRRGRRHLRLLMWNLSLRRAWHLEGRRSQCRWRGTFRTAASSLQLDALSAFFLLPIFLICALAALYGTEYLETYRGRKALASPWFFLNLLVASMVVVVLARNGILFLMAWEMMALVVVFPGHFRRRERRYPSRGMDIPCREPHRHGVPARALRPARQGKRVAGFRSLHRIVGRGTSVHACAGRIWHQGGFCPIARLAPGGASCRAQPCLGGDVGRHDQDWHLRACFAS